MAENALPYPTPTRLRLMESIGARKVEHYPFIRPETSDSTTGNLVTVRVMMFVAAGLADIPECQPGEHVAVEPTDEGRAWYQRATGNVLVEPKAEGEGPGSTSPEPGPPAEVTHACPPPGTGVTPCCGRTPFELPRTDRMTLQSDLVNCAAGHSTEDGAA